MLAVLLVGGCSSAGSGDEPPRAAAAATVESPTGSADVAGSLMADGSLAASTVEGESRPYRLVYQSDVGGRPKIFTIDVETRQVRQLTTGTDWRDEGPRWSPDGQFIAFSSNRAHYGPGAEQGQPDYDIYVMRADGSDIRRVTTDPGNDETPSWMPDGQSIVFTSDRASRGDLFRVHLADGRTDRLTSNFVGRAIMPTVSPDGRRVAFGGQTLRAGAFWNYQVHVLDLATGRSEPVPASGGACWPAWSPDGRVLFNVQLDREPSAIQQRILATGAESVAYSDPALWAYYPRVSPDGQWLALSVSPEHHEGENWDLMLVSTTDPTIRVRLTQGPGNDRLPDWHPQR